MTDLKCGKTTSWSTGKVTYLAAAVVPVENLYESPENIGHGEHGPVAGHDYVPRRALLNSAALAGAKKFSAVNNLGTSAAGRQTIQPGGCFCYFEGSDQACAEQFSIMNNYG